MPEGLLEAAAELLERIKEHRAEGRILPEPEEAQVCERCGGTRLIRKDEGDDVLSEFCPVCVVAVKEQQTRDELRRACGLPKSVREFRFTSLAPDLEQSIARNVPTVQRYAEELEGWLVLCGRPDGFGAGKTRLAACVANAALDRGVQVSWTNAPQLMDYLRASYQADDAFYRRFTALLDCELLVIDDLGAQRDTEWTTEKFYQLLNHRLEEMLPTVITMNGKPERLDGRIASRLATEGFVTTIDLAGKDLRKSHGLGHTRL